MLLEHNCLLFKHHAVVATAQQCGKCGMMHKRVSHFIALLDASLEQGDAILQSLSLLIAPLAIAGLLDWTSPGARSLHGSIGQLMEMEI